MKKSIVTIALFVITTLGIGQTINQVGYYAINGIHALSSKSGVMILGNGDLVSIADPSMPELTGNFSVPGFSTAVLAEEEHAYFGTGMNVKLIIANISNPNFPLQSSTLSFPETGGGIFGMAKDNGILYLAMGSAGIYSVDVSNPSAPVVLDTLVIENGQARDISVQMDFAFIAHADGLKVINISNPSNMQLISSIGSGYNAIGLDDNIVFAGKSMGGVDVFDISDPENPSPAFAIANSGGTTWDLQYRENHLYLATNSNGLFIYEIQGNSALEMANFPNSGNGQSFGVCLQDSLILLSGLINGVAILQYDNTGTVDVTTLSKMDHYFYPNPATDYVTISKGNLLPRRITIFDMNGNLVKQVVPESPIERIDISELSKGQYLINLETRDTIISEKIVKVE